MDKPEISPIFTDLVVKRAMKILERHKERVNYIYHPKNEDVILEREKEMLTIFDSVRFEIPLEYAVVRGIYSGENGDSKPIRKIHRWVCGYKSKRVFSSDHDKLELKVISKLVKDIFGASFDLGRTLYRNEQDRHLRYLSSEDGRDMIFSLVNTFFNDQNRGNEVARRIWNQYESGKFPRIAV